MSGGEYLLDNRADDAGHRFDALSAIFNPVTFRHLTELGVGPGWRCWEVGAGGPTVPRWLAAQAGPTGTVVATDIDVSWLRDDADPFQVVRHDVAGDPPPGEGFDLVHARLVLSHVLDRDVALDRMVRALRPGGWLVVEDFDSDLQPFSCLEAGEPAHQVANRIRAGFLRLLAGRGVDLGYGRRLPRLLRERGLRDVRADGYFPVALDAGAELDEANVRQVREELIGLGDLSPAEIDGHLAALRAGRLDIATPALITAVGRAPRS